MQLRKVSYFVIGLIIGSVPISGYIHLQMADIQTRLENEKSTLQKQVAALTVEMHGLEVQGAELRTKVAQLQEQLSKVDKDYDALKTRWSLWRRHAELAPQPRDAIQVWGNIHKAGTYEINRTSVLISFPQPDKCLTTLLTPGTGSMRPAFYGNHQLIIDRCIGKENLRPGDIITFHNSQGRILVHQIIDVSPDGLVTKGIYNEVLDPYVVKWEDVRGVVVAIIY